MMESLGVGLSSSSTKHNTVTHFRSKSEMSPLNLPLDSASSFGEFDRTQSNSRLNPNNSRGRLLPPKSPSSTTLRLLSTNTSRGTSSSSRRRRRRSKDKRKSKSSAKSSSSCEPQCERTPEDPTPDHLDISTDSDDDLSWSIADDFSMVSFEKKTTTTTSPTSVAADPFKNMNHQNNNKKSLHRRAHSWDSSDTYQQQTGNSKTCLHVPKVFRRQKVMSADVASVSNASDTLVSVEKGRMTGRELHETAKEVLNAGDYDQAVQMFESLQKAQIERFGEDHSSVGAAMHNVGVVRLRMGQHDIAEQILLRAVRIRRNVLGNDHLDLAASLTKLGACRIVLQKFDDALHDLRDALRITRRTLGRCHKTVAQILCQIACLFYEAGEMFSAQATFEDALEIFRDVFPKEADRDICMIQITETLCNIGSIRNKQKNFTGAIECFREALDLQRGIMGHDHPKVIATLDNLGYSFSKHKSYNQALTCYKEMLSAQLSHTGSFTMGCCDTLKKQILIYEKLKKLDGAYKATNKALHRLGRRGSNDPVVKEVSKLLLDLKEKRRKRTGAC